MTPDLLALLKTIKDGVLCYSVRLEYGQQEPGLDDTGMPDDERQMRLTALPAGFLGSLVIAYQGSLGELLALDLFAPPEALPNPPRDALMRGPYDLLPGAFCWGSADCVAEWTRGDKLAKRRERWVTSQ